MTPPTVRPRRAGRRPCATIILRMSFTRTERHAESNLRSAAPDEVRKDAIDAETRQQQSESAKRCQHNGVYPLRRDRMADYFVEGMYFPNRQIRIEALDKGANLWEYSLRISTGLDDELGRYGDASVGKIDCERWSTVEASLQRISDNTDNFGVAVKLPLPQDCVLADGIFIREEQPGKGRTEQDRPMRDHRLTRLIPDGLIR